MTGTAGSWDFDVLCDFASKPRPMKRVVVIRLARVRVVVSQRYVAVDRAREPVNLIPVLQGVLQVDDSLAFALFAATWTAGLQGDCAPQLLQPLDLVR